MSISYSDFRQERTNLYLDDEKLRINLDDEKLLINFNDEKLRINFDAVDEKLRFPSYVNIPRELIAISPRLKLHAFLGC